MIEITDQMTDREFLAWCRGNYSMPRDAIYRLHELAGHVQWAGWPDSYCDAAELRIDLAEARKLARIWEQTAHAVQNELALSREMAKERMAALECTCESDPLGRCVVHHTEIERLKAEIATLKEALEFRSKWRV